MKIIDRIEQAACEVINLSEAEKDIYNGAGWKLARFEGGVLVGFFDPAEAGEGWGKAAAQTALENATAWLANAEGEVWLVMCSCYQLCAPRRIRITDAAGLAYMAQIFGEIFAENL